MSACRFIAADTPLEEIQPTKEYELHIELDNGIIEDGGADDNFFLLSFSDVKDFTDKSYGVKLEWNYTDGRAHQVLRYLEEVLDNTEVVELWHVWLMDYYEYEDSPVIHKRTVSIKEMTICDLYKLDNADIWNSPDKNTPSRPSFYCLRITR